MNFLNYLFVSLFLIYIYKPIYNKNNMETKMVSRSENSVYKRVSSERANHVLRIANFSVSASTFASQSDLTIKATVIPSSWSIFFYCYVYDKDNNLDDSYYTFRSKSNAFGYYYHPVFTNAPSWEGDYNFVFGYEENYGREKVVFANFTLTFKKKDFGSSNKIEIYRSINCYPYDGYTDIYGDLWEIKNLSHNYTFNNYTLFSFNDLKMKLYFELGSSSYVNNGSISIKVTPQYKNNKAYPEVYAKSYKLSKSSYQNKDDTYLIKNNNTFYLDPSTDVLYSSSSTNLTSTNNFYFPKDYYEKYKEVTFTLTLSNFCDYSFTSNYKFKVKYLTGPTIEKYFDVIGEIDDLIGDSELEEIDLS